jgi:TolB-like protein/DNA-binding winged helix-turn-helix (wHTH) protein/Flp pilus assembly protein TadD
MKVVGWVQGRPRLVADSNNAAAHLFRFDTFEFDRRALELRRDGVKIKLEGQPLQILGMLVERPGELVTREDLRKQLWPGNTIVDFEHSINAAMKRLREALGDSVETPRFIETLPRRGYRFKPTVQSACAQAVTRTRRYGWQASVLALGILAIGLIAVNAFGLRDRFVGAGPGPASIALAVLPFKNLSGDPSQNYYADGISEALITELGKIGRLQVLSFQSASRYRQTPKALPEIARELQVDALLEGSVVRSGDRVRITAKLFQVAPERQLLAESYEFEARDVVAVQAEVARDVATRARIRLTPQEQARLASARRVDPEAYEAYLLGRAYFLNYGPETPAKAKAYYEKSIAKDPTYAPAYAGLAELYTGRLWAFPVAMRMQARQLAEKALTLDDSLAEAHTALGKISQQEWDWVGTERAYRRAIETNPSYALARVWYAIYLFGTERFDEAVEQAEHAQRVDPVSSYVNTLAGMAYLLAGDAGKARAPWQRVIDLDPLHSLASRYMAESYLKDRNYDRAIGILERQLSYTPKETFVLGALAHSYARAGRRVEALKLTRELVRREASGEVQETVPMIWAYVGLQEYDEAFARLEKLAAARRDRMIWLRVDPWLEPLYGDPRFQDIVRRMNLPTKTVQR